MDKEKRLRQEWVEQDIQRAVNCRECPATHKECNIPNPQTADSLSLWVEYINRCAKNNSSDIFSVSDKARFVECCNDCSVYKNYQRRQEKTKPTVQNPKRWSLMEDICLAWYLFKSRLR